MPGCWRARRRCLDGTCLSDGSGRVCLDRDCDGDNEWGSCLRELSRFRSRLMWRRDRGRPTRLLDREADRAYGLSGLLLDDDPLSGRAQPAEADLLLNRSRRGPRISGCSCAISERGASR